MNILKLKQDITFTTCLLGQSLVFKSTWGLFSPKSIDEGSELLLRQLELKPTDTVLDVGCGYGVLGVAVAGKVPQGSVDMVDKDFVAVEYALKNIAGNKLTNINAYLSNGFSAVPKEAQYDIIVSNLPAKVGKEMLTILLEDVKRHLKPDGSLYVVTVSGLRQYIKREFESVFGNYEKCKQGRTYTVAKAIKN